MLTPIENDQRWRKSEIHNSHNIWSRYLFMGKPLILSEAPVLDQPGTALDQPCTRREATFRDADARRHSSRADKGYPPWAVVAVVPQKKVLRICSRIQKKMTNASGGWTRLELIEALPREKNFWTIKWWTAWKRSLLYLTKRHPHKLNEFPEWMLAF